jgi:hypothetical protein
MSHANVFSFGDFTWWNGVVEDRKGDPLQLGRVKVRVFGYHTSDTGRLPTEHLMWAQIMQPVSSAALSGIGQSPTGLLEGSHVFGFFMDGGNAQVPVVMGTLAGIPSEKKTGEGFNDPNGVYPAYPLGEPDVNRLARGVSKGTVIEQKNSNLDSASGVSTFKEPKSPYAAKYPYNQVRETESGHIEEFDDTEGAERYHRYHPSGTFVEIHPDGTRVDKIAKDKYSIVAGDDYLHVSGDVKILVEGDAEIKVGGDATIEIDGDKKETVKGDYKLNINGNYEVTTGGHYYNDAGSQTKMTAPRIDLN